MVARIFRETDVIEVSNPPVLVFGQPGSGKTSIAQTASRPITLDFDAGSHRSAFRKTTLRIDSWEDLISVQRNGIPGELAPRFADFDTIVLDTIGSMLKFMSRSIIAGNPKMGTNAGNLSQNGWGVLKSLFDNWLAELRSWGKQVIMIAHEKEEKDGDAKIVRPDIAGGSYGIVVQSADIVGYLSYRNNTRFIGWDPTDAYFAKNGAGLVSGPVPDFRLTPDFMAGLLTEAKKNLGKTAAASAAVAKATEEWGTWLGEEPAIEVFNARLPKLGELPVSLKAQVWALLQRHAESRGWTFDKAAKVFTAPQKAAEREPGVEDEESPDFQAEASGEASQEAHTKTASDEPKPSRRKKAGAA